MKTMVATIWLAFLIVGSLSWGQTPLLVGDEFQVNTYISGRQDYPAVGIDADGNFVVVWRSDVSGGTDTSFFSVQGQRFDATGAQIGDQFQVNSYTTNYQQQISVAVDSDGDFVVVWASDGSDGTDDDQPSIQGQRFDSVGPLGGEFQVNSYTSGKQWYPWVDFGADGSFVVVWASYGSAGSDTAYGSVQGQRFNAVGNAVGNQFQVNTYTSRSQYCPVVAVDGDGRFVIAWTSYGASITDTDTEPGSIHGQRFDSAGDPAGDEFQINTYTTSYQNYPAVASNADGNFVVVWNSPGSSGTDDYFNSIQGQSFESAGVTVGGEFQVNTFTTSFQRNPAIAAGAGDNFVVMWDSDGSSGSDDNLDSIQGQLFDGSGASVGFEFQINSYTTGLQRRPAVAVGSGGNIVVAWESGIVAIPGPDGSASSVQAQLLTTTFIFADGFESGNTSTWSTSAP